MPREQCTSSQRGPQGPQGPVGPTGPGFTGAVGVMIPFSSNSISITVAPGNTTGSIGYGANSATISNTITPFIENGALYFTAPRAGVLTQLVGNLVVIIDEGVASGSAQLLLLTGPTGALSPTTISGSSTVNFSNSTIVTYVFPTVPLSIPVGVGTEIEIAFSINTTSSLDYTVNINGGLLIV